MNWESPIEIKDDCVIIHDAPNEKTTNLNKLKQEGKVIEETRCYDEAEVYVGWIRKPLSEKRIASIINKFKKQGFNVTKKAIIHNYNSWLIDMKSGYRDEENGYYLFSPCGCNPLQFRASTLDKRCDWQETYAV